MYSCEWRDEKSEGEDEMHDNSETSISSAKALMEFSQKKDNDAKKREAADKKTSQLASDQLALLKESNALATKLLTEKALCESNKIDVVDIKPNFFGLGANLNEAWRRFKKWRSK